MEKYENLKVKINIAGFCLLFFCVFVLSPYIVYLRFTAQPEFFCWLWNSPEIVQEVTGWTFLAYLVSIAMMNFGKTDSSED